MPQPRAAELDCPANAEGAAAPADSFEPDLEQGRLSTICRAATGDAEVWFRGATDSSASSAGMPVAPQGTEMGQTGSNEHRVTRRLLSQFRLQEENGQLCGDSLAKLAETTFKDTRWDLALSHVKANWTEREDVERLIRKGAKSFGFWHLSDDVVATLTHHLLGQDKSVSPALAAWIETHTTQVVNQGSDTLRTRRFVSDAGPRPTAAPTPSIRPTIGGRVDAMVDTVSAHVDRLVPPTGRAATFTKAALFMLVLVISLAYAVHVVVEMYPGLVPHFGPLVFIARTCGMATLLWTALLFIFMSRSVFKIAGLYFQRRRCFHLLLDQQKELHMFCGKMLGVAALVHTLCHLFGTAPAVISLPLDATNAVLGCAHPDTTPYYLGVRMRWLQMPACPFTEKPSYLGVVFQTTPGLSGIALVVLLAVISITARPAWRKSSFELFMYVHQVSIPLWLILLFIHGSNGWIGVGFPLVVFVCTVPFLMHCQDRIVRLVRYYLLTGRYVNITNVVIRPGEGNQSKGALTNLMLSKPPIFWRHQTGMYAFLCMPEYAPCQWHPFTICSGPHDSTVDFIIHSCGDWTNELAKRCLDAEKTGKLPVVALDGPYLAPAVSAMDSEVLICVGAGVGITPFLSMLATLVATLAGAQDDKDAAGKPRLPLKEAHFFWLTRSADELLFGRRHFSKIISDANLKDRVFLHLHVTAKPRDKDVASFLFYEAARRQSRIDRPAFERAVASTTTTVDLIHGAQLPWCWVNKSAQDIIWVSSLVEADDAAEEQAHSSFEGHWAAGIKSLTHFQACGSKVATRVPSAGSGSRVTGLFRRMGSAFSALSHHAAPAPTVPTGLDAYLPVVLGRPNFEAEIRAIGKARPTTNVDVYVCGNDGLVASLQTACEACARSAQQEAKETGEQAQSYRVHFERFG